MARKAARKRAAAKPISGDSERDRIIAAFMAILGEKPIEAIDMAEVADRARTTLADLRNEFASTVAILAAHMKAIDRAVLAGGDADMAEEPPRERLFDVLMRRIEALSPHRDAIRSLLRSARFDPALAFALNGLAVRSQQWMLTAAGISAAGPKGMARAQGLALLYAQVLGTWVEDDDPGLARTMAALDRALARGQSWSGLLDSVCRIPAIVCGARGRRGARRQGDEEAAAA
jgi:AcrR family transcriptional regulator